MQASYPRETSSRRSSTPARRRSAGMPLPGQVVAQHPRPPRPTARPPGTPARRRGAAEPGLNRSARCRSSRRCASLPPDHQPRQRAAAASSSPRRAHPRHVLPGEQRVGQRDAVDVLEIAAHRQPARQSGDPHAGPGEQLLEVGGRHLALHRGVGGEDHLAHAAGPHPREQAVDPERLRARSRRAGRAGRRARGSGRGTPSSARSPAPTAASSTTQSSAGVTPGIAADFAALLLRQVAALGAGAHRVATCVEGPRQARRLVRAAAGAGERSGAAPSSGRCRGAARAR